MESLWDVLTTVSSIIGFITSLYAPYAVYRRFRRLSRRRPGRTAHPNPNGTWTFLQNVVITAFQAVRGRIHRGQFILGLFVFAMTCVASEWQEAMREYAPFLHFWFPLALIGPTIARGHCVYSVLLCFLMAITSAVIAKQPFWIWLPANSVAWVAPAIIFRLLGWRLSSNRGKYSAVVYLAGGAGYALIGASIAYLTVGIASHLGLVSAFSSVQLFAAWLCGDISAWAFGYYFWTKICEWAGPVPGIPRQLTFHPATDGAPDRDATGSENPRRPAA